MQIEKMVVELQMQSYKFDIITKDNSFVRIFIDLSNTILKIDFVNDIPYRTGELENHDIYSKIDSKMNILSNKLSALTRFETKDVVDIVYLSNNFDFQWQDAFFHAQQKDIWVNPIDAAKVLDSFPISELDEIIWTDYPPRNNWFSECIYKITKDIIRGDINSMYNHS